MSNKNNEVPVPWREWGEDAFREARELDRPILLDIGAVWCHWCHVMDHGIPGDRVHTGTYSIPEVVRQINEKFIPVKVDNDRRPDINARYNMGGWPSTVFLNPSGEILYGETYVPPDRMIGLLDYISNVWSDKRNELHTRSEKVRSKRSIHKGERTQSTSIDLATVEEVSAAINRSFDQQYGGFGTEPKFPHPAALLFALERFQQTGNNQWQILVQKTLDGMADGGMFDQFAGGFFRYSTTRDWTIPHYEKMLEDNVRLISVYCKASMLLKEERYADTVRWVHQWLMGEMRNPETGAFSGSQDADEEERYYGRPLSERATLPTPTIDATVYCSWNALAVTALVDSSYLLGDDNLIDEAQRTYRFLQDHLTMRSGEPDDWTAMIMTRRYFADGAPAGASSLLTDQTDFANAAIALYESTGQLQYLVDAAQSANTILQTLKFGELGGFMDVAPDSEAIGELAHPKFDLNDNSEAALMLLRLSVLVGKAEYRREAIRTVQFFSQDYRKQGLFAAAYARTVGAATEFTPHIVVVGNRSDVFELQIAAHSAQLAGKTVETVLLDTQDSSDISGISRPETLTRELAKNGGPKAYVCTGDRCLAPVTKPEELLLLLQSQVGQLRADRPESMS